MRSKKGTVINAARLSQIIGAPVIEPGEEAAGLTPAEIARAINMAQAQNGPVTYLAADRGGAGRNQRHLHNARPIAHGSCPACHLPLRAGRVEVLAKPQPHAAARRGGANRNRSWQKTSIAQRGAGPVFQAREAWADRTAEEVIRRAPAPCAKLRRHRRPGRLATRSWAGRSSSPSCGPHSYGVATIATEMSGLVDAWVFIPVTAVISGAIESPFIRDFLVGDFGVLTMGVMNAVVTVVPILIIFFLIVNFLEDVGYLPNLSVLLNRFFSYFGLSGKAVLSLSLGFGCNTMATLTSRMLESRKERIIASFLIALGIPCAVQLGVMIAILATAPFSALVIVILAVFATQMVSGVIMNRTLKSDRTPDFILELPAFKWPSLRNIWLKTYYRVKIFLVEALPLFVLGAALMFFLDKTGLLALIKKVVEPGDRRASRPAGAGHRGLHTRPVAQGAWRCLF